MESLEVLMEIPLTPLEFARRARRLYANCEAIVDGNLRFTYEAFLDRCDRWSAVLQSLGVRQGDRVACIAPKFACATGIVLRGPSDRRGLFR